MHRPRLFISAVSEELRSARQAVARTVYSLGFDPVTQDDFPTGHGELRQWLRDQIRSCEGVLQLVGQGYGAEPPEEDADYGRVSYTQFELLYARLQGKKTWEILVGDGCQRDTPADRLDLPRDPAHPDPASYQAERRRLQEEYVARLRQENHLRHDAPGDAELQIVVLRLRDELGELRSHAERQERRLTFTLGGILACVLLLAAGGWWAYQHLRGTVIEVGRVDTARIRAHLVTAAEQTRQRELAEAEKPSGWDERQRLREAAEAAHAVRLQRVEALAAAIAEIEGRGDAPALMREMTRVLSEEGVDAALAYLGTQREGVLQRVRTRAAQATEQNRAELEPLLTAAGLEATRGRPDAARAAYEEIVAIEPEWTRALVAYAWFLRDQSVQEVTHGSLVQAVGDALRIQELVERLPQADKLAPEDVRVLPAAMHQVGDVLVLRGQPGDAEQALRHYQRSLEVNERLLADNPESAQAARDVSISLERLGDFLSSRRQPGDADKALGHYERSLKVRERLQGDNPESAEAVRDVSVSLNKLATFLAIRGQPGDAELSSGHFERSLNLCERLLADSPESAEAARDVSVSLELLSDFLVRWGQPSDAARALGHLERSLRIRERLLADNPQSVQAARFVSASLGKTANLLASRGRPGDSVRALSHLERSLRVLEQLLQDNPQSAQAARDVSVSLIQLGDFLATRGQPGDAEQVLRHYQHSLDLRERLLTENSQSAQAARDVSVSLERLGDFLAMREQPDDAAEVPRRYQSSLELRERLLAANPESAEAARDVWVLCWRLASLAEQTGTGDAMAWWRKAFEILDKMKREGRFLMPDDEASLETLRQKVKP